MCSSCYCILAMKVLVLVVVLLWSRSCRAKDCSGTGGNVGPCKCKGNGDGIDINVGKIFEDLYPYKLSLCDPISCNPEDDVTAVACQTQTRIKLGQVNSYRWKITDNTHFSITYGDGEPVSPTTDRQVRVEFTAKPYIQQPTIAFAGQDVSNKSHNIYVFQAQIRDNNNNDDFNFYDPSFITIISVVPVASIIFIFFIIVIVVVTVMCAVWKCHNRRRRRPLLSSYVLMPGNNAA